MGEVLSGTRRRKTVLVVVAGIYLLGAGLILLWPTSVSAPFRGFLMALRSTVPYGDRLLEIGANVLLFLPAGWLAAVLVGRGRRWLVLLGGAAVSLTVELAQAVLLPGRVPSFRDVLANSVGVGLGVALASLLDRRRARAQPVGDDRLAS